MKTVVVGGTGLIGSRLVTRLRQHGHEVVVAAPETGVDTVSGAGLATALTGAEVVVDVTNSPSYDADTAWNFFVASGTNLMALERAAGVAHHVLLSVVGTDRLQDSGYFRGKLAQEQIVRESDLPFSIIRSTQFFEFIARIATFSTVGNVVRISPASVQPVAADDVVELLTTTVSRRPSRMIEEVAGPHSFQLNSVVESILVGTNDGRVVIPDPDARYLGALLDDRSLMPDGTAMIATISLERWLEGIGRATTTPGPGTFVVRSSGSPQRSSPHDAAILGRG